MKKQGEYSITSSDTYGENDMPGEDFIEWKRKQEDARAWDKRSATYQDDHDVATKRFNLITFIVLFFILVLEIIIPFIGLLNGS